MQITITTPDGPVKAMCYGTFYVNLDGTDVLFAFTDVPGMDKLALTEYMSGLAFPADLNEPSGLTLELDSPMREDDPYFVRLIHYANRMIDDTLLNREMKRWRLLELIQMNQRKHKANEIDL